MSAAAGLGRQRAVVMGLGLFGGGAAAARFLARGGADVLVTDTRDEDTLAPALAELQGLALETRLGEHREQDFTEADLVVVNPAVPPSSRFVRSAREAGARITSELELFLEACPAPVALISGTQGKSSCANFLAQLLDGGGRRVWLGGNIGHSLLDDLPAMGSGDLVVAEISSYQLEALPAQPLPAVRSAALVNVLSDHLERHGDAAGYAAAKARLLALVAAGGTLVLPAALAAAEPFAGGLRACLITQLLAAGEGPAFVKDGKIHLEGRPLAPATDLKVLGSFQLDNLCVALCLARAMGATSGHLAGRIAGLRGLPHRLEDLGSRGGLRVVDNGVCTTPDSALSALTSLDGPCTLLVGGQPKAGLPFDGLAAACAARGTRVLAFGAAGPALQQVFAGAGAQVCDFPTLEEAVAAAYASASPGETLLFAPACASFDAYANFRARAEDFRAMLPSP